MNSIDSYSGGAIPTTDAPGIELPQPEMSDPKVLAALLQLAGMPADEKSTEEAASDPLALAAMLQLIGGTTKDASNTVPVTGPVIDGAVQGDAGAETMAALFTPLLPETEATLPQSVPADVQQEAPASKPQDVLDAKVVTISTDDGATDPEQAGKDSMGDNILQSLTAQSSQQAPAASTPVSGPSVPHVDQASRIESFVSQIADRILVTDPLSGQNAQVHIKIADHILPGTELQLWRGEAGQLNVNFSTTSLQSAQVLSDAAQLLTQRLNERLSLSQPVIVTVQSGDSGMPQDGRSRQYQSIYDMLAAEQPST